VSAPLALRITGIGTWAPGAPDWQHLRGVLRGESVHADDAPARPAGAMLAAAERRRAPDGVRLAAEVAAQATSMAGIDASTVPCIFASTHGEIGITDYVCETLARAPLELSPTKFHNSVLNAPAGYWTIATGCTAASSAVSAHHRSFAGGLLEAAVFACSGPLVEMTRTTLAFGAALVLAPTASTGARLSLALGDAAHEPFAGTGLALPDVAGDNPANAHALALLQRLAVEPTSRLRLPLSSGLSLDMEITP
jgi:hypothetical protein